LFFLICAPAAPVFSCTPHLLGRHSYYSICAQKNATFLQDFSNTILDEILTKISPKIDTFAKSVPENTKEPINNNRFSKETRCAGTNLQQVVEV
jgi:hypothetical protein